MSKETDTPHVEVINLKRVYPQSKRYILLKSLQWIILTAVMVFSYWAFQHYTPQDFRDLPALQLLDQVVSAIVMTAVILCCLKLLWEACELWAFYYGIELEHLIINKGIIVKTRSSIPISKIIDVTLFRGPIELVLALYQLRIFTPGAIETIVSIEGLPRRRAIALQNHLLALIETTLPQPNEHAANEVVDFPLAANTSETSRLHPPKNREQHASH